MRYIRANSFFANGSEPWIINAATSMVIIKGMVANRVPIPRRIKREQKTSAKTASARLIGEPKPRGSGKTPESLEKPINLFQPCPKSIKAPTPTRKINMDKSSLIVSSCLESIFGKVPGAVNEIVRTSKADRFDTSNCGWQIPFSVLPAPGPVHRRSCQV